MKTTKEVLVEAKAIISDPKRWTQGALVEEGEGGRHCYCALGALAKVSGMKQPISSPSAYEPTPAMIALAAAIEPDFVPEHDDAADLVYSFNDDDETSHAAVMAAFDKAIEACS